MFMPQSYLSDANSHPSSLRYLHKIFQGSFYIQDNKLKIVMKNVDEKRYTSYEEGDVIEVEDPIIKGKIYIRSIGLDII